MNVESFVVQGQAELRLFYSPYFNTQAALEIFLFDALDYEKGSLEKRQMLYQVQRFVSLANDIDKLRPGRDCLRMLFIKICLESLCSLSGYTNKQKNLFFKNRTDSRGGKIYSAVVPKSAVVAFYGDREEQEVVLDVFAVKDSITEYKAK